MDFDLEWIVQPAMSSSSDQPIILISIYCRARTQPAQRPQALSCSCTTVSFAATMSRPPRSPSGDKTPSTERSQPTADGETVGVRRRGRPARSVNLARPFKSKRCSSEHIKRGKKIEEQPQVSRHQARTNADRIAPRRVPSEAAQPPHPQRRSTSDRQPTATVQAGGRRGSSRSAPSSFQTQGESDQLTGRCPSWTAESTKVDRRNGRDDHGSPIT